MSAQIERAKRLTIMALTIRDGYKLSSTGCMEAFGVGRRTAERDLVALGDIIPVIQCGKHSYEILWGLMHD